MTRWDLVYKWADPETRSIVDAVTSALENCDRKLTEAEAASPAALDVNLLREAFHRHDTTHNGGCGHWCAEDIAAEYARLSPSEGSGDGGGEGE